jgi:hypothetical protein
MSFKRNVIETLNADLFLYIHTDSTKERHGVTQIYNDQDVNITLNFLEPKRVEIIERRLLASHFNPHPMNCVPQLLNHKKCADMVKKVEKEENFEYAWILSTRPDLNWLEPFPELGLFPTTTMWALMSTSHFLGSVHNKDMAMLIPRHYVDSVMTGPQSGCQTKNQFRVPESQIIRTYCGYEPTGGCECEQAKCFGLLRVPYGWFFSNVTINRKDSAHVPPQAPEFIRNSTISNATSLTNTTSSILTTEAKKRRCR